MSVKFAQTILRLMAKAVLWKHQPQIIGITGSIGKTSAKEAIFAVLKQRFQVFASLKNYNNEWGVPLTVLLSASPGRAIDKWLLLFLQFIKLMLSGTYPKILILEMGVDRPGDMDYLNSIVKVDIGIVTYISNSHLENFKMIENTAKEKRKLVDNLNKEGLALLNYDNVYTREMTTSGNFRFLTFGTESGADIIAKDVSLTEGGLRFKVDYQGSTVPFFLEHVFSFTAVYAVLAAVGVGINLGMNLIEISGALPEFTLPLGRMNLIAGHHGALLIDDSYNAAPDSTIAALKVLNDFPGNFNRRAAVLGDMLELGDESLVGHQAVGKYLADLNLDFLVVVGKLAKQIGISSGFARDKVFYFDTAMEAGEFLKAQATAGDLFLIKGSQGARMEQAVKAAMLKPEEAEKLLVRQGSKWLI